MGLKSILEMFQYHDDEYEEFGEFDGSADSDTSLNKNTADTEKEEQKEEEIDLLDSKNVVRRDEFEQRKVRMPKVERPVGSKIVPIKSVARNLEVHIMKPASFSESQDICDMLIEGRAAVVNLEGFDPVEAQRIMDFVSGCVYAINGKLHQISKYIFIFSPETIDISGDYLDLVQSEGFGVPTINNEF